MIRVAVVDDNARLIRAITQTLSCFDEVEVLFTANSGLQVIEKLQAAAQLPQVVLMDIEMDGMDGIAATARVRSEFSDVKVIMLTVFDQEDKVFEAILAGAHGYLLKDAKPGKLIEALEEAVAGGAPMSPDIAAKALSMIRNGGAHPAAPKAPPSQTLPSDYALTRRETEILECAASGLSYQQIADRLFISRGTVKKHIENIYGKLRVNSKVGAVRIAMENKWFESR